MHELSIADSILNHVRAEAEKYPGSRVKKVGLKLGELSGVDRESLSFCFEVLAKDSDLDPIALEIQPCERDELQLSYLELEE